MNKAIKYGIIFFVIIVLFFTPERILFSGDTSLCIFKRLTDIQCPLCGMTRAGYDILHLRLLQAFRYNPVIMFLPLLMLVEMIYDFVPSLNIRRFRQIVYILLIGALTVLFVVRIAEYFRH